MRLSIRQYALSLLDLEKELDVDQIKEVATRFFSWLIRRGEARKMGRIIREAENIVREQSGMTEVVVTTAHEADTMTQALLKKGADKIFAPKKVVASFVTDKHLIGGLKMRSAEILYDNTLATSLRKLRTGLVK